MIADLKPYAEYKESGLPWLGKVPGHWESRRLRHVCDMRVSNVDKHTKPAETPVRLCNYVEVYKNERIRESTRFMAATVSEDERVRFGLRIGDVLITKDSEQWNDIGVPALVEYEAPDLVCGYHLAILRSRPGLQGAFLHRALESHFIAAQFHVEANGVTRYGLSHGAIQGVAIPLPPPDEQAAIVRFLDWANGRLERAIRAKRRQLALVREMVSVVIEDALQQQGTTRRRLLTVTQVVSRPIDRRGDQTYTRIGLYNRGRGIFKKPTVPGTDLGDSEFFTVLDGDLVISGQFAWEGAVAFARSKESGCIASHRYPILRGRDGVTSSAFLFAFFRSSYGAMLLDQNSRGAAGRNRPLNLARLLKEVVPIPPLAAQERIAALLEQEYSVSQSVDRTSAIINEYRTRLVADVVTGRLDVREAVAKLPAPPDDEATEPAPEEPLEEIEDEESEL